MAEPMVPLNIRPFRTYLHATKRCCRLEVGTHLRTHSCSTYPNSHTLTVLGVRTSLRSHHRIRNHTRHLQTLNHPHQSPGQPQPTSRPRPLNDETMDERVPSPIPQSHQIPTDIEPHPPIAGQDPPPDPQSQPTSRSLN